MYKGEQTVTPATIRSVNFLADPQGLGYAEYTVIEKARSESFKPFGFSVKMPETQAPAAPASDMKSLLIWIVVVVVIVYLFK